uniref:G-protein coupled receptors family 3 profile domain-containing protein n=1 Tax=Parascaris univalens TaxID=6257 RepID=A0A915BDY5_PARUN
MGLPAQGFTFPKHSFTLLCHSRISILMVGFTFAYGSMFAKVWVVYRMGASENQEVASQQTTDESIPACKFYLVIAAFFVVDFFIISIWVFFDPLQREEKRFPLQEPPAGTEEDVMLLPILELCQSMHQEVWIGLIMGYKCLLLVFGLLLAYESRNLKLRFVNDSRFVGLAIYNVAILSLVTGPVVTLLIRSQADANFAFVSVTVLLCTYISLGLVFLPKILHIYRVPESSDENSMVGSQFRTKLSKVEQKRFEQLVLENAELKHQIEIKERKISECREQLRRRLNGVGASQN